MTFNPARRSSFFLQGLIIAFFTLSFFFIASHSHADTITADHENQSIVNENAQIPDPSVTEESVHESVQVSQYPDLSRVHWLEIFFEIFQKYAVLVFLSFLLIFIPYFRKQLVADQLQGLARGLIGFVAIFLALLFGMLDFAKYGESAWAFLDYQIILTMIGGLMGGFPIGLIAGGLLAFIRLWLEPQHWFYATSVFSAGVITGLASSRLQSYRNTLKLTLVTGLIVGFLHGVLFYLPLSSMMSTGKLLMSISFLGVFEALAVVLFFFVLAEILRNDDRRETEKQLLKTRLLFLQAQMSPHFLFNALNAISSLCDEENATRSRSLVIKLSDFLRQTLRREESKVTLKEEFTYIDAYLEIEQTRFGQKLTIDRDIKIEDTTWNRKIPILILQPLVENAVKHGIAKKEDGGTVKIVLVENEKEFSVSVADDGPGMRPEGVDAIMQGDRPKGESSGIGIRNICERLKRHFGAEAKICFETNDGNGCLVRVDFPKNNRTL